MNKKIKCAWCGIESEVLGYTSKFCTKECLSNAVVANMEAINGRIEFERFCNENP